MDPQECEYADKYRIRKLLGDGGQANVYLGCFDWKFYALKVYFPGKEDAFNCEVAFLKELHFMHLINMVDYKVDAAVKLKNKDLAITPLLVLELADGGELFQFISKTGRFRPEVCRTYTKQLVAAVKYLAEKGVTHRDLKPENILFDKYFTLKVSDFGLSRDAAGTNKDYKLSSVVGTDGYRAPEMEAGKYTGLQADLFAVGVILFIMYKGSPPFLSTKTHDKIYKLIRQRNFVKFWAMHEKGRQPGFFPDSFKRLINSFFSAEVDRRPTFESLEEDDWLNGDQAMNDLLQEDMNVRREKILETDPNRRQIDRIRREQFECEVMQEQKPDQNHGMDRPMSNFIRFYRDCQVDMSELQVYQKNDVSYYSRKPAFILAWVNDFLQQCLKNKEVFLSDFLQELEPISFDAKFNHEEKEIDVILKFKVDNEDVTELIVTGKLHRWGQQIGVEWAKVQGNEFWLTAVIAKINSSLQAIA